MKKVLAFVLAALMVMSLAACGGNTSTTTAATTTKAPETTTTKAAEGTTTQAAASTSAAAPSANWPAGGNIRYIMTAKAGGGLDINARILAPYWEKVLGGKVTVNVENLTGGANWVGWQAMFDATPDGMTISNIHTPQVYAYLNKSLANTNTLDSFNLVCNYVTDSVTFVVRADDKRFANVTDLKSFVETLKASKDDFLVALTSKGGADELAMLELMDQTGITNLIGVNHSDGIAAQKASFLGKDCDIYIGKVGDTLPMYTEGTVKVLAVCKTTRSASLSEIPTALEQGYNLVFGSSRGIVTQPGVPADVKAAMVESLREACSNPAFLKEMEEGGYEVDWMEGEAYEKYMKEQEAIIIKYADVLGYN